MTEGIIQKVLQKWIKYALSGEHDLIPRNSFELQEIEEELIREIKKNVSEWSKHHSPPLPRYIKLDVLIGDSK